MNESISYVDLCAYIVQKCEKYKTDGKQVTSQMMIFSEISSSLKKDISISLSS